MAHLRMLAPFMTGKSFSPKTVFAGLALLTVGRLVALYWSPLELGGDEAQYWAWSQTPAFGYFSKPPLIAWVIALTTFIFGNAEWAIRLSAPLAHALTAFFLFHAGQLSGEGTNGKTTGTLAALIYMLMPGVWFSSGIMTTDALLLPAIAGALVAYFSLLRAPTMLAAAGLGLAIGIGFLAKYAMIYFGLGLLVLLLLDPATRSVFFSRYGLIATMIALALITPNLLWNAAHQFATVSHTINNAGWENLHLSPLSALKFLGGQMGVFGLLAFPALLASLYWALRDKAAPATAKRLAVFSLLPLLIVTIEAVLNRANANWAFSAYVPASLLLAYWGGRGKSAALGGALLVNLLSGLALVTIALSPPLVARLGLDNAFKRVHGWHHSAQLIADLNRRDDQEKPYDALVIDNRLFYYAIKYYGRQMNLPKMYIWTRFATPHSHAELVNPLAPGFDGRLLVVSARRAYVQRMAADFNQFSRRGTYVVPLGGNKKRKFAVFEAQGYRPLVRDEAYEQQWPIDDVSW
ncbi:MAG: glycosyltransferase family 39 protein [Robiginitomaculum sp.]|nr:glycosyltransferase family 39 protein [Robiginitomaculum sp.]MDQ7076320.1 glycosyltransferase family 39 protein [Robiginitomaculum sp.]